MSGDDYVGGNPVPFAASANLKVNIPKKEMIEFLEDHIIQLTQLLKSLTSETRLLPVDTPWPIHSVTFHCNGPG
jgi:hypothetical protein